VPTVWLFCFLGEVMKEVEYQLILAISGVHVEETKRLIDKCSDDFYVAKLATSYKLADQIDAFNKTNPSNPIPRTEEQVLHGDIKEHWTKITPFDFLDIIIHGGFEQQNGKLVPKKNKTTRALNTSSTTDEFVARFQALGPQEFMKEFNYFQFYDRIQRDKKEILALRKDKGNDQRINTKLPRIEKWEEAFQDWHFETYNKYLETETAEESSKYSFIKNGDRWLITINNVTKDYNHSDGFYYLAYLYGHENTELTPLQLEAVFSKKFIEPKAGLYKKMTKDQLDEQNLKDDLVDDVEAFNDRTEQNVKKRFREIAVEISDIEESNDLSRDEELARLQEESSQILKYLGRGTGKIGQKRKAINSPKEKARVRVYKNIDRARRKIVKDFPEYKNLFYKNLFTGNQLSYRPHPNNPINWDISH